MPPVLVIVGATATGKSALAMELAGPLDGEIVNSDALQVYRGFDIGTAKPSVEERRRVPHHLLDILEPHEAYSAGEFARRARRVIGEIRGRERLPILVGGSGLYLQALIEGISPIPSVDAKIRQRLRRRLADEGREALRAELRRLDPATSERLAAGDTQRLLRALEVALGTGRPLSAWIAEKPRGEGGLEALWIGLTLSRALLYDRLAVRVGRMLASGWVEEVRRLLAAGHSPSLPAFQAIGYRQLAEHVAGKTTLDEASEQIIRATRRYAKRQLTWFRNRPGIEWFPVEDTTAPRVLDHLARAGLQA